MFSSILMWTGSHIKFFGIGKISWNDNIWDFINIKTCWSTTYENSFQVSYGLKPTHHEDCQEAAAISRALAEAREDAKQENTQDKK